MAHVHYEHRACSAENRLEHARDSVSRISEEKSPRYKARGFSFLIG